MTSTSTLSGLRAWCESVLAEYEDVVPKDSTETMLSHGLAFVALIHSRRSDLVPHPNQLIKMNHAHNHHLAFTVAEQKLGVPRLLDLLHFDDDKNNNEGSVEGTEHKETKRKEDNVENKENGVEGDGNEDNNDKDAEKVSNRQPQFDSLSLWTYVSQLHQALYSTTQVSDTNEEAILSVPSLDNVSRSDVCVICGKQVFLLERLVIINKLMHRTCFKCARCGAQLALAGFYETERGQFCCEICPDEEKRQTKVVEDNRRKILAMKESQDESGSSESESDSDHERSSSALMEVKEEDEENQDEGPERTADIVRDKKQKVILNDSEEKDIVVNSAETERETKVAIVDISEGAKVDNAVEANNSGLEEVDSANGVKIEGKAEEEEKLGEEFSGTKGSATKEKDNCLQEDEVTSVEDVKDVKGSSEVLENALLTAKKENETLSNDDSDVQDSEEQNIKSLDETQTHKSTANEGRFEVEANLEETGKNRDKSMDQTEQAEEEDTKDDETTDILPKQPDVTVTYSEDREEAHHDSHKTKKELYPDDLNPFGTDSEEDKEFPKEESKPKSTNPFGSDDSESEDDKSISSLNNSMNLIGAAPPKPPRVSLNPFGSDEEEEEETGSRMATPSPASTIRLRKKRHAPPPPTPTRPTPPPPSNTPTTPTTKASTAISATKLSSFAPDKSQLEGQWKRKKGPAPPRPVPPRRTVKVVDNRSLDVQLHDIEVKQSELERQGVALEQKIRDLKKKQESDVVDGETNGEIDSKKNNLVEEELTAQLFDLIQEKTELERRQTRLLYFKKDQRLEEQHADLEHKIRLLMIIPKAKKSCCEQNEEEELIKQLMSIVSQRNQIVDMLELDRIRNRTDEEHCTNNSQEQNGAIEERIRRHALSQSSTLMRGLLEKGGTLKILKKKKKKKDKKKKKEKEKDEKVSEKSNLNSETKSPSVVSLNEETKKSKSTPEKAKKLKKKIFASLAGTPTKKQ